MSSATRGSRLLPHFLRDPRPSFPLPMTPELTELFTFLRFPSVSTDSSHNEDTRACAEWLLAKLQKIGLSATLYETARHPVVVAKNKHIAGRRTVLMYGHYDVQPDAPVNEWKTPP